MAMTIGRARRLIVAIGGAVILTLSVAAAARADSCSAAGEFKFNAAGGRGYLSLSAEGTVEMTWVRGHNICALCSDVAPTLRGTYSTAVIDQGCYFQMGLSPFPFIGTRDTIVGMVAFGGQQLVFAASTSPDFASGLALRFDALTGR
jgi:hypothetical protein